MSSRYLPIEDYAFLSDCRSSALVSRDGSVDWACMPRFDSGSVFGRLLDAERGGHLSMRPAGELTASRRAYLDGTLVLQSEWTTATGTVRCTDALGVDGDELDGDSFPRLLRRAEVVEGEVELAVEIVPRFDYGATRPWLRPHGPGRVSAVGGDDSLVVHCTSELTITRDACRVDGRVTLSEGESVELVAIAMPAYRSDPDLADAGEVEERLDQTAAWWREWSSRTSVEGEHAGLVARSAEVLKGLTCAPTGAVVAAATTSLPEVPGGSANWDYRYSWVRDAHVAVSALADVGHTDTAEGFRDFVVRSAAGHADELQIMFGPYGERQLPERVLDLEGWNGASPVRIGNGAATQIQHDVYGHLLGAARLWEADGNPIDDEEWAFLCSVVDLAASRWEDPDHGVWELRGSPRHYVHSKVMVWLALDSALALVDDRGYPSPTADRWRQARHDVRHAVETRGVDPDRGNFVQHYGTTALDASLLKLPLVGFVDADDERMRATTDAIEHELAVAPDGFLRRFVPDDPDQGSEGVFLLCSFWMVEVLALQGRTDEARSLFDRLAALGNDVGLFAEEFDPVERRMLGNYPQAFTHLGLVAAATRLAATSG